MADERAALETFLRSIDDSLVAFVNCLTTAGYGTKKRLENATREGLLTVSGLRQGDGDLINGHFSRVVQESVLTAVPEREQVVQSVKEVLPSPSSYANNMDPRSWSSAKLEKVLHLMRTHRPAGVQGFQQLPVALLDRTLGQVEEDCAHATPSARDTEFARKLMIAMSSSFANEAARRDMFWDMIREEFPTILFQRYTDDVMETDGSAHIHVSQGLALGINLVVKLDIGSGHGDLRLQNCSTAALYHCSGRRDLLRACCRCPTLLMELSGPNLSLSGFAFGKHFCCDQLSQTVSLLWQPKREVMISAPRLVFALRRAWPALQTFYKELDNQPEPNQSQLAFPYPTSYPSLRGPQRHGFSYIERLTNYTFHAVADGPAADSHIRSTEPELFIKFCKNYSVEAHEALHHAGFAPRLHGCELLPGRWLMVVMEYLPSARTWDATDAREKPRDALRAAIDALHEAGFVHGDLRGCNVLVDKERVYVTDLEWAGKVGEAKYPIFMNHDIDWPPDAGDNKPITKDRDVYWMNKLLSD